jgi:DNA replication protein DnaC
MSAASERTVRSAQCRCGGTCRLEDTSSGVLRVVACDCAKTCGASGKDSFGIGWVCDGYHVVGEHDRCVPCPVAGPRMRTVACLDAACLPHEHAKASLSDWRPSGQVLQELRELLLAGSGAFLWGAPSAKPWPGQPVVGKTWLLAAAVRHAAEQGRSARYVSIPDLYAELREAMNGGCPAWWGGRKHRPTVDSVLDVYASVHVLAIDELGKSRDTEWECEQLWRLVDKRYRAHRLVTLAASNWAPAELEDRIGERGEALITRLEQMCPSVKIGASFNPKGRQGGLL